MRNNLNLFIALSLFSALNLSCSKEEVPCVKTTWYYDADADGLGDKSKPYDACERPAGYVSNSTDDNDNPVKNMIPTKGYTTPTSYANLKLTWAD